MELDLKGGVQREVAVVITAAPLGAVAAIVDVHVQGGCLLFRNSGSWGGGEKEREEREREIVEGKEREKRGRRGRRERGGQKERREQVEREREQREKRVVGEGDHGRREMGRQRW